MYVVVVEVVHVDDEDGHLHKRGAQIVRGGEWCYVVVAYMRGKEEALVLGRRYKKGQVLFLVKFARCLGHPFKERLPATRQPTSLCSAPCGRDMGGSGDKYNEERLMKFCFSTPE